MNNPKRQNLHPVFAQFKALLKELDKVIEKHVQNIVNQIEAEDYRSSEEG